MFQHIFNFPEQLEHAMQIGQCNDYACNYNNIHAIVCVGMGGSGMAGNIAHLLCKSMLRVPFLAIKDYAIPEWCNNNTLVILISYSGNTGGDLIMSC